MSLVARPLLSIGGAVLYLWLAVIGIGGLQRFLSHPPLIALTAIFFILAIVAIFAGGTLSSGIREDRRNRWVLPVVVIVSFASAYVPAWNDRIGFWTIDGDAVRWLGVVLVAIGGTLRLVPVFILGKRFSGLVAIQHGHTLVSSGLYGVIRHPSYLGLMITAFGWALAFRSGVGVLLAALLIPTLVARMNSEEALLRSEFGSEYDAYRARTSRLIPGLY
jgi:protein-S-isoprenylcysteine O-methyltransferase Ste14